MNDVLSLILGGGRGRHLYPLTKERSEPAVPIAGKYRLIDIPVSNCLNSGLSRIYVLTQFLSVSLHRHISDTYKFDPFGRGFVAVLAAQQTNESADWYLGTADAVRQNLRYIEDDPCRDVLILSGDQLYRMDFRVLQKAHLESQADVTLAVLPVTAAQASRLGILRLNDQLRIEALVEKPHSADQLAPFRTPAAWLEQHGVGGPGREYLANLGIYLFKREVLIDLLRSPPRATDFVMDLFSNALKTHRFQAYLHQGYWEDLGSIKSYHEASLALASDRPPFDFHTPEGVIFTRVRYLPASRVSGAQVEQSLISDGCVVQAGTQMHRCLIGVRSRIGRQVSLRDTVFIGANRFESDEDRASNRERGVPDLGVGERSVLERAIVDKDCRIGHDVQIVNRQNLQHADGPNFVIRDGIVVIPNRSVIPDGTVI
jgi:glucose-1-phosphate adenylyltransferase